MKRIICYVAIIFLVFMIFLPPILRMLDNKEDKVIIPDRKVNVLTCTKENENVNTSYLNDKAYNLQYQIKGDYTNLEDDDTIQLTTIQTSIKDYSTVNYDINLFNTEYRIDFYSLTNIPVQLQNYALPINSQQTFYQQLGFNCSIK